LSTKGNTLSLDLLEIRNDLWWPRNESSCYNWTALEADLPDHLMTHVKDKQVMVQAGGNMGWFTKLYAKHFERMYVFEPDNINFLCLNLNVPDRHVMKFQACIGNTREMCTVSFREHDRGKNHVMRGNDLEKRFRKGGRPDYIPTLLIDDLNLEVCSFIHLDIEGFEYFALQGARQTISRCKPVIALEKSGHNTRYGVSWEDIEKFLFEFGYRQIDAYRYEVVFAL
jgi:FkbM family methyltransferase